MVIHAYRHSSPCTLNWHITGNNRCYWNRKWERNRHRETASKTDRQTGRQTDRKYCLLVLMKVWHKRNAQWTSCFTLLNASSSLFLNCKAWHQLPLSPSRVCTTWRNSWGCFKSHWSSPILMWPLEILSTRSTKKRYDFSTIAATSLVRYLLKVSLSVGTIKDTCFE